MDNIFTTFQRLTFAIVILLTILVVLVIITTLVFALVLTVCHMILRLRSRRWHRDRRYPAYSANAGYQTGRISGKSGAILFP